MYKNNNKGVSKTEFNSKRKMKSLFASLSILSSVGVAVGVGASVATHQSYSSNSDSNISKDESTNNSAALSFSTSSSVVSSQTVGGSSSSNSSSSNESTTISPSNYNKTEKLTTDKGEKKDILVSKLTKNNRSFMPILAYSDDDASNYVSGRSGSDVEHDNYNGWTKSEAIATSNNYAWSYSYTANDILKGAYSSVTPTIKVLSISLEIAKDDNLTANDIASFINSQSGTTMVKFFEVRNDNVNLLPDLSSNTEIQKVQIVASLQNMNGVNELTSLPKNLTFPKNTKEIEFYTPDVKSIDPLAIPQDASVISDNTPLSARFENIDLSSHANLSESDLQKAIDIVYKTRINERAFQGHFAGGYIYSWNLIGTGITSFNNVVIPELNDGTGRFYIAYVAVSSSGNIVNGEVNETMKPSNTASNDSQIKEWYDSNSNGWSTVTTVKVSVSNGQEISYDQALQEIIGYVNKYPNVNKIDISSVKLSDNKTLDDLSKALNETFKSLEKTIEIITTTSSK